MSNQKRRHELEVLIAQAQALVKTYENELALSQNPSNSLDLKRNLHTTLSAIDNYEDELLELGPAATDYSLLTTFTTANFSQEVVSSELPVLVDFWAEWCGPCKQLEPLLVDLAQELAEQVKFGRLNVDEEPQIATQLNVQSLPTLLVIHNRRVVEAISGAVTLARLRASLQKVTR